MADSEMYEKSVETVWSSSELSLFRMNEKREGEVDIKYKKRLEVWTFSTQQTLHVQQISIYLYTVYPNKCSCRHYCSLRRRSSA